MLQALRLLARDDMDHETVGLPRNRGDRHKPGRRLPLDPATQKIVALQSQYDLHRNLLKTFPLSNQRSGTSTGSLRVTGERPDHPSMDVPAFHRRGTKVEQF